MRQFSYMKGALAVMAVVLFLSFISVFERAGMYVMVAILGFLGVVLLCLAGALLNRAVIRPAHRLYARDFSLKFLATVMGLFLVLGTLLYMYVFHTIGNDPGMDHKVEFNNVEYLLRSLICSLDLFMLDVDSNILDRLDGHAALKGWITVQAALSFSCTVAMLVSLVYSRIRAHIRLAYRTKINNDRNHLYLFFGVNEPSRLLIKDICRKDPKGVAVLIDEANIKEDDNDEWNGIVGLIAHKQKVFKTADGIGAAVAIASQQLADIDEEVVSRDDFDAFGYLGVGKVRKLIDRLAKTSAPQLHIFFMDDDEERNIRNIIALAKDTTILDVAAKGVVSHRIYCHARYNGPNRVIQDVALKKKLNIRIVDSSHMAVELLKHDPEYHPVNVASISQAEPTTVDRPFSALIVGFGEVGRDAFRFLYEFGAFVDSNATDFFAERSVFKCTIVDRDLDKIKGGFKALMPNIFPPGDENEKNPIQFRAIDYNHADFYDAVLTEEFVRELNYVVISIGDNDEAIALGARIFNRVRRLRKDMDNLRILVRCTDDAKVEYVRKIADHYNQGYGRGKDNVPVIRIFGQPENTYTFDLVISDRLIEAGKRFHENYRTLRGEGDSWDMRRKNLADTPLPDIDRLRRLRRQESQDFANAFHAGTKIALLRKALGENYDWERFYVRYFKADGSPDVAGRKSTIHYPGLDEKENKVILRLAMLEHLRWVAAHELLGYQLNEKEGLCNEQTMRHNCLRPWSELDETGDKADWPCDYKSHDFCVVDTSISLSRDILCGNPY